MQSDVEAHQYTGSVLSLNAIQLWILGGEYKDVDDHNSLKQNNGYVYAMLDNESIVHLQLLKGDWVILDNGRFFKASNLDWMNRKRPMCKSA